MAFLMRYSKADLLLLADELGENATDEFKKLQLKKLIVKSKNYEEETVKEFLESLVSERKEQKAERERSEQAERERKQQAERERKRQQDFELAKLEIETRERIEVEKLKLERQIKGFYSENSKEVALNGKVRTLDDIIKTVKLLTVNVPSKPEGWNFFFTSLEKAFSSEEVKKEQRARILTCLLGERAANLLVHLKEGEYNDYEALKTVVLREYEPSPKVCWEKFKRATRNPEENFAQFSTRLTSMWSYYCKLRKAENAETINQLIVADKLLETLDPETATHIEVKQGESWFKPRVLAKECDNFFAAKGKSYAKTWRKDKESERNFQSGEIRGKSRETEGTFGNRPHRQTTFGGDKEKADQKQNQSCFNCGSRKHFKRDCPERNKSEKKVFRTEITDSENQFEGEEERVIVAKVGMLGREIPKGAIKNKLCELKREKISVSGKQINALVDSGSEITVIKQDLVAGFLHGNNSAIYLKGIFGPPVRCPLVSIPLALVKGEREVVVHQEILCAVAESLVDDMLIPPQVVERLAGGGKKHEGGGIQKEDETGEENLNSKEKVQSGSGRNEAGVETHNIISNNVTSNIEISKGENVGEERKFRDEQKECNELKQSWGNAKKGKGGYYIVDGFLCHREKVMGETIGQLVVPQVRRKEILRLAHSSVFGGHMGIKKTLERIRYSFYWEGLKREVQDFCAACVNCQLTRPVKIKDRAPITPVARPDLPFQVVNMDCIGPIEPKSSRGHRYILCLVDQHTRWEEAIPLTSLTAKSTCEALQQIFSRTGITNVIASDNGTNFIADLTKEFEKRIGSCPRFSTPLYPASNGLVERFNSTLKRMLHHTIREEGRTWHSQIPYVL